MNEREVAELRRRFKADKSNITHVCGCYVNENKEIISEFDQSLATLREEESEKLLAILRRTLSGTLGRNLLDITFETKQVVEGAEHRLLMSLRSSALKDKEALQTFFQHAIQCTRCNALDGIPPHQHTIRVKQECITFHLPGFLIHGGTHLDTSDFSIFCSHAFYTYTKFM